MSNQHRTYPTLEPKGEITIVPRPENVVKIVFYPASGDHLELVLEKKAAFDLAMEMLQHLYRMGEA